MYITLRRHIAAAALQIALGLIIGTHNSNHFVGGRENVDTSCLSQIAGCLNRCNIYCTHRFIATCGPCGYVVLIRFRMAAAVFTTNELIVFIGLLSCTRFFVFFFFLSNAWHRLQRSAAPHQGADSRSSNNTHRVDWNLWLRMENMAPLANKMELGWFNCFEICSHCRQGIRGRSVMWTLLEIERIDLIDWEIGKWPRWLRTVRQVARCVCVWGREGFSWWRPYRVTPLTQIFGCNS